MQKQGQQLCEKDRGREMVGRLRLGSSELWEENPWSRTMNHKAHQMPVLLQMPALHVFEGECEPHFKLHSQDFLLKLQLNA